MTSVISQWWPVEDNEGSYFTHEGDLNSPDLKSRDLCSGNEWGGDQQS